MICDFTVSQSLDNIELTDAQAAKLKKADLIVVPSCIEGSACYAQEAIEFVKYCHEKNPCIDVDLLDDGEVRTRVLNSADIWMPIIWIAKEVLLPIAVSLVASFIFERFKTQRDEEANLHVDFVVEKDGDKKRLSYSGPAREFQECFENVDLNELWSQ